MNSNMKAARQGLAGVAIGLSLIVAGSAIGQDATVSAEDVYKDVEATMGGVPTFVKQLPKSALAALWALERDLEISDKTALDGKTKALISLAVAAQIPCEYCIWADTNAARQFGATDEEIAEAVAMAGLTRNYSTLFNGLQVDFETFKKELGGQ
jgi:AhpD family alkylhydroperoxidase